MSAFFDFLYDNEGKVGWRMNQDAKEKLKETLYREMMAYDAGDPARIQHFVKVHSFAQAIGKAEKLEEVPIGCVIVQNDKIIARGYNRRNTDKNTLSHAELTAIKKASKKTGDWRLEDCVMYVTLEPCQMCAGAIVQSRMKKVVIGTMNPKAGCAGSVMNLLQVAAFNHQVEIERGVLEEECSDMLSEFFRRLREKKKQQKMKAKP